MELKSRCTFRLESQAGGGIASNPLDHDIRCGVAIIGGRITGAMSAYERTRAGLDAATLDRGRCRPFLLMR
jgi:hypothetical protein